MLPFLIDTLPAEVSRVIARIPLSLTAINALVVLCVWPLPDIRFLSDPSAVWSGVAMNSCNLLGLHTGKDSHAEFNRSTYRSYQFIYTDEEATYTWAGYNIIRQKSVSLSCGSVRRYR